VASSDAQLTVTYLITFSCYGAHLHGDESGSIDRKHNQPGTPVIAADRGRTSLERGLMDQAAYTLDQPRRDAVLFSILERATQLGWAVLAGHVRTNHVHIVIDADATPERVMNDLKSYASRCLNQAGFDSPNRKRWARHGSTRWLRSRTNIDSAMRYVIEKQGDPMAIYVAECRH
jgi:REP element-mobilizing transposase RayT